MNSFDELKPDVVCSVVASDAVIVLVGCGLGVVGKVLCVGADVIVVVGCSVVVCPEVLVGSS